MAVDLQQLAQALEASLDPSTNKQGACLTHFFFTVRTNSRTAELAILQEERKPNFSLSLLQIVASESYTSTARLASALYFKNHIKRNWTVRAQMLREVRPQIVAHGMVG